MFRLGSREIGRTAVRRRRVAATALAGALALAVVVPAAPASAAGTRVDLRVLVVDDGSVMVGAIVDQLDLEGVPHTDVALSSPGRPAITSSFLSDGNEGFYQAVVLPQGTGSSWVSSDRLSADELTALHAYESAFSVRQVDADDVPGPSLGLQPYSGQGPLTWAGSLDGMTATVTPAARAAGWSYLSGSVPFRAGTYAILSTPLTATTTPVLPAGAAFVPFVTLPIPGTNAPGTLIGSYTDAGVEQLVITGAFSSPLQQFRMLAHGIVTWATRGVHFGLNRAYYSQQFDDAFSYDSRWNPTYNCTPGEDCAPNLNVPDSDIRMTAADVTRLVSWQRSNHYTPTLAFNGYYSLYDNEGTAWNGTDGLTSAFVANRTAIRWLNHGFEHVYQGCVQDFTVIPWRCRTTDGLPPEADGGNIVWTPQATISSEISANVARAQALGLPFDRAEYLSGEHSGLYLSPQQPVDNPAFASALAANDVRYVGADASREPNGRPVGPAITIPRHPVAVFYNVSTVAEEVDEYNWFYLSAADGGSGYCESNPATATCMTAPLSTTTGFTSYILPNDVANDLRFILSNDPRPFYAHTSNLTAPDYLGLSLMSSILTTYRASYASSAPLVNQSLSDAATTLARQAAWRETGMPVDSPVSGYVQDGVVTIDNPTAVAAPVTVPTGTRFLGTTFGSFYGGEYSEWVNGSATLTSPLPTFIGAASATLPVGVAATVPITATGALGYTVAGTVPDGLAFVDNGNGTAAISGTPAPGSTGVYPLTITATNDAGSAVRTFTVTVVAPPVITSPATATFTAGTVGSFTITTTGFPAPTLSLSGTLPRGITFASLGNGTAALSGNPTGTARSYPVTVTATSSAGRSTQALVVTVLQAPVFTSPSTLNVRVGVTTTFAVRTTGNPAATLSIVGTLPTGMTFTPGTAGTAVIGGAPAPGSAGVYPLTLQATSTAGEASQAFTLTVRQEPTFTSPSSFAVAVGVPFSLDIVATGVPVPTIRALTTLPAGVTLAAHPDGTATLAGTLATASTRTVILRATSYAGSDYQAVTIVAS